MKYDLKFDEADEAESSYNLLTRLIQLKRQNRVSANELARAG